jgi:integrase
MKTKCSVKFYLEKRIDKELGNLITENVPIFLFFSYDGKRLQYFTGYRINIDQWNAETQRVRRNNFNKKGESATDINDHLSNIESVVTEIYKQQKANKKNPSVNFVRDELKQRLGEVERNQESLFNVFEKFIATESQLNSWSKGTVTKITTIKNQLKDFYKIYKFDFENMDENFFNAYLKFQMDSKENKGLNLRNSTISKNLKIFKWFMNWATKKGFNENLTYKDFNPKLKGTKIQKIIFLTWPELMKVYEKKIPKKYLDQVRDVFCFTCFTGLRYSDVYNLKYSDIKDGFIEITTIKTSDPLQIDLNTYSKAILEKYKGYNFPGNKALPVISNQNFNLYLKELGQFCELTEPETVVYFKGNERNEETFQKWELLSTHVGRKTFVSNALFFNIPAEVVMSWTGHKDHRIMESYYKIIAPQKRREMNKFNEN